METQRAGVFRGCHVFDTHEATFYLDDTGKIVGLESDKIRKQIFGEITGKSVVGGIGNPVVFAIENMTDGEKETILQELNITYAYRISQLLLLNEGIQQKQQAA